MPKSKVDLYAAIRRDAKGGMSLRAVMRKYGVGYETVQKALISALPEPRKQRHTAERIYDRLLDEHGADVSYQMVRGLSLPAARRSGWRPARVWSTRSSRRPTDQAPRPRSTSGTSRSSWPANW
ncbi:hypothetical protein OG763_42800 [Streptomyces sp. NBC_01230]|uniref:hypothetical protein n=1 Tax=Streptomyces sp. NBC_01230 TaxID=2903784 RepID=UPI002E156577|nr:hypothetical protein OG763_42800 [Streptomyces sp. NBC_01230]